MAKELENPRNNMNDDGDFIGFWIILQESSGCKTHTEKNGRSKWLYLSLSMTKINKTDLLLTAAMGSRIA